MRIGGLHPASWVVAILALVEGGWLLYDGLHAFRTGDYVTPSSGPRAGQLGPWSKLPRALGLDPRGRAVRGAHVLVGAAWIASLVGWVAGASWSWAAMLACAVLGLAYLPLGTLLSALQICLLLLPALRPGSGTG